MLQSTHYYMKRLLKIIIVAFLSICLVAVLKSCKKITLPVVTTENVSGVTQTSAVSGGNVTNNGGAKVTARGVCWNTTSDPTTNSSTVSGGTGNGPFISNITGLIPNTEYHVRAYATNSEGTSYGNEVDFTTGQEIIRDFDGNVYNVVHIGTQVWMKENLKTTKFNEGASIPLVTDNTLWGYLTSPGYCWYNNDASTYKFTYGALYNWYAVNTGILCPAGWHVPSDSEWTTLINYLGGFNIAGRKLKETGTAHWISPNVGTNESGFTGLPGGLRHSIGGAFESIGTGADWWSATESSTSSAWNFGTVNNWENIARDNDVKQVGLSVRCIKD